MKPSRDPGRIVQTLGLEYPSNQAVSPGDCDAVGCSELTAQELGLTPVDSAFMDALAASLSMPSFVVHKMAFGDPDDPLTEKFLKEEEASKYAKDLFRNCVLDLMKKRGIVKPSEVYTAAHVSRYTFSRTMSFKDEHQPAKETVAALAIGLKCTLDEAQELYHSAGYHLGMMDLSDRIIRFFIRERRFSVSEVNYCLYYFKQPLIGEQSRSSGASKGKKKGKTAKKPRGK